MINEGFTYRELLGPRAEGLPLAEYLARRYPHSSIEQWRDRLESGQVLLDGSPAAAQARARRGQELLWRRPPWQEPKAPGTFATVYEDSDLLAVAKPAGLPTLPGAGYLKTTLLYLVRQAAPEAAPVHRLGRWTSGLVLFARHAKARAELCRQWRSLEIGKLYLALASGLPPEEEFSVGTPIGPVPHPWLGSVHAASPMGKPARSLVKVLERREGAFLAQVRILTGRPHQIRIHLAAAGHPLVGDPLYVRGGGLLEDCRAVPGDGGYCLHAAELSLRHPRDGRQLVLRAPPPEPLLAATAAAAAKP